MTTLYVYQLEYIKNLNNHLYSLENILSNPFLIQPFDGSQSRKEWLTAGTCALLNSSIWIVDNNQREIYWLTVGSNKRFLIITGFFPFRFSGIATAVGPLLCAILQNQLIWNISTSTTNKLVFDYIVSYSDKKFLL